jgi:hypothetical protein
MSRRYPSSQSADHSGIRVGRAVVIVAAAVTVAVLLLLDLGHRHPAKSASVGTTRTTVTTVPSSTTTTTVPLVAPPEVKLQVLNGLISGTLSSQWSAKLHAKPGYITLPPDNTTAEDTTSAIYIITPGFEPEAVALAKTVGLPTSAIVTAVPPPPTAPIPSLDLSGADGANLVLVIGQNLAAQA